MNNPIYWDNIPTEFTALPHWVLWRYQAVKNHRGDEKRTKVPFRADLKGKAASDNSATWAMFDVARATFEAGDFDGVGFMLGDDAGIIGVDLDHCFDPETGEIAPWAHAIVTALETYTEITPSGEGLRCFGLGTLPPSGRKKGDFECYEKLRFLTVTGRILDESKRELLEITAPFAVIHASFWTPEPKRAPRLTPSGGASFDDKTLLDKMLSSKSGDKWRALYEGNFEGFYSSQSEADSALCFTLAFWTGRDGTAIDRLFRTSGLMRDKWDERHGSDGRTYGQLTVDHAVNKTANVYDPEKGRPAVIKGRKKASAFISGADPDEAPEDDLPDTDDEDERQINEGLYGIQNGRTVLIISKEKADANGSSDVTAKHFVCDFAAHITRKTHGEDGQMTFHVEGVTIGKTAFELSFPSGEITDARKMAFRLGGVIGDGIAIHAGMEKHLGPSIQAFTDRSKTVHIRTFERTGWTNDLREFIIPGMEKPDTEIILDRALPFRVEPCADGVAADLELLLSAHLDTITPIAFTHALFASMSRKANLQDEKFAAFIVGRSGTLKTSWAQMNMCIYGDFATDDKLLKLGAGGTVNSMMDYPAKAADLPLLFDNFKPGTGAGQKDATTLVHGLMEGTERKRLNRDGTQRVAKELRCFLQFTGEDTIHDAASVARMLILNASDPGAACVQALTQLQARAHFLPRIGGAWLSWIQSIEAETIIAREAATLGERRGKWLAFLRKHSREMVNAMRVATSLACCEIAFSVARVCPAFAATLHWWQERFDQALLKCAADMTGYSAQSHEANRYISTLRSLVVGQRAYLQEKARDPDKDERRVFVGWQDDERIYLLPDAAFNAVLDTLRNHPNALNGLSPNTIAKQLDQLGFLDQTDGAHFAVKRSLGIESGRPRVLIVRRDKFFDEEEENDFAP